MDNRKIGVIVILAFSVFTAVSAIPYVQASTIYVPDNYTTIQSAVNAAFPGDTIIVESGTYKENVIMDKKLTLIGDAFATIDAQGKGGAINITVSLQDSDASMLLNHGALV
jgi:nitrous oxidase accessory protein